MKWRGIRKNLWLSITIVLVIFVVGIVVGYIGKSLTAVPVVITAVRDSKNGYPLINPVLYTELPESLSYPKYSALKDALTKYVAIAKQNESVSQVAVYYRDMNGSQWVGINPKDTYNPASMLKVVTLIGVLQAGESNPHIFTDNIKVPSSVAIPTADDQTFYPPKDPVKSGISYSVNDLISRMIVHSDNGANALLTTFLGDSVTSNNYANLHIPIPSKGTTADVSPQQYSRLFRILYNSSYLNTEDSEKALQLLSTTDFVDGLVAGVPQGITVAHKFGENMYPPETPSDPSSGAPGLNDCGIVYYPDHPYFLCVMTKGKDFPTLAGVIKDISHITWQQVQAVYPAKS
ncbi:MAG: serine hydrolase [Candidatus Paceibacterota bacterium]